MCVPLAALILGSETETDGNLPVLLPVAGQTLVEFHARIACAHGAGHIVLVADRMPGALLAAVDRLKSGGIPVDVVRTAAEAADSIHPDEDVVVLSGNVVVRPDQLSALMDGQGSVLLTLSDTPETQHFERIDAQDRWTGIALLNGNIVRETANMLGDWQLGPTLLRVALQKGVRRVQALDGTSVSQLAGPQDAARASEALAAHTLPGIDDWFDRYVVAPLSGFIAGKAMPHQVSVGVLAAFSAALIILALALAVFGFVAGGLSVFIVSALPVAVADILGQIGARTSPLVARFRRWKMPVLVTLILIAGVGAWRAQGSVLLLTLSVWAAMLAVVFSDLQRRVAHYPLWQPGGFALAAIMLPFFAAGWVAAGLGVAIMLLFAAQFWLQRNLPEA